MGLLVRGASIVVLGLVLGACSSAAAPLDEARDGGSADAALGGADAADDPDGAGRDADPSDAEGSPDTSMTFDAWVPGSDDAATDAGTGVDAELTADAEVVVDTGIAADSGVAVDSGTWRSALYPSTWTPAFTDSSGRFLHDFSYAGYARGERPIPDVTTNVVDVTTLGADPTGMTDGTAAVQSAIDAVEALGGGVVFFPAGDYRVEGRLRVEASGVVLRGAGRTTSRVFFATPTPTGGAGLTFAGAPSSGPDVLLAADGEARSERVSVADVSTFAVGDDVDVGFVITDDFITDHGMTGTWMVSNGQWRAFFRRTIVAIEQDVPPRLVLDVPLRYPVKTRDAASVRRVTGLLREVGLEDLGISDAVSLTAARANDRVHAVAFTGVADAWVRRVTSFRSPAANSNHHFASGGILVERSKRVTITDVVLERAQNRGSGGNGYLFELMMSNEVLVSDSIGRAGRHNFIQNWDFSTNGCVFLRVTSEDGRAEDILSTVALSEFHHSLAMANLIDGAISNDGWGAVNRRNESSGAGHSATENVFWNVRGGVVRSMQFGWGYVIGTEGVSIETSLADIFGRARGTAPEDFVEGADEGDRLEPPSLYEDQRTRRLGP